MEPEAIERRKREIERDYGTWSAQNFQLRDDLYTIAPGAHWHHAARLRRAVQLVHGLAGKPVSQLRILDLGALEGLFAVEFARRGADVVAIEGRAANVEKIRFAKEALELDNLEVRHEDVRHLDSASHGVFDVVLCLGVVCLLDAPEALIFLEQLRRVCRNVLLLEAETTLVADTVTSYRGRRYFGQFVPGEDLDADPMADQSRWTAIGNRRSLRMSPASLVNALGDAGFPLVLECHLPAPSYAAAANRTYVALAREDVDIVAVPTFAGQPRFRLDDRRARWAARVTTKVRPVVGRAVPASLRPRVRRILSRVVGTE